MRGSQRVGMSTKKDAARPFGLGIFLWQRSQDEDRNEQRQGIIITMVSCLLCDRMIISQRLPPVLSYAQSGREPL